MPLYQVQAWCKKVHTASIFIEASSPQQIRELVKTNEVQKEFIDAAEEENGKYPWDTFEVYDQFGKLVAAKPGPEEYWLLTVSYNAGQTKFTTCHGPLAEYAMGYPDYPILYSIPITEEQYKKLQGRI